MIAVPSTEVKTHFGKYLNKALVSPIMVTKTGQEVVVMLSKEEYDRLEALEDSYWLMKAQLAEKSGYMGASEGTKLIDALSDAKS